MRAHDDKIVCRKDSNIKIVKRRVSTHKITLQQVERVNIATVSLPPAYPPIPVRMSLIFTAYVMQRPGGHRSLSRTNLEKK